MYIVAGPNGAGKSTLTSRARHILGLEPIDADAIQRDTGMSSGDAWAEGLRRCRQALDDGASFLVETTLAGRDRTRRSTYLNLMAEAKSRGFRVDLTYIALENADAHVARVADRVAGGQHDIPESLIRERYERSRERAVEAMGIADHTLLIDNSSVTIPFRELVEIDNRRIVAKSDDVPEWADEIVWRFLVL
ncbi:MAG TPA: zeta toxin family protein [Candidatus Elarobacter sp.]|jgi:predicted ABC-type ATPase